MSEGIGVGRAVSIVVPHLNQPEALRRCLRSLIEQDWPEADREIVVVDNGSTALPDLGEWNGRNVRLIAEPTPGPGPARSTGVGAARADLLLFIDADCRAGAGWIAAMVAALGAPDATGVVGGDVRIDFVDDRRLTPLEAYEAVFAYRQQLYIARDRFSGTGNLALRRTVFEAVGPFAGIGVAEDRDWGRRAAAAGYPPRYAPDAIVYHPARVRIDEMDQKWRRHIAHDLAEAGRSLPARLRWNARSLAVLASIVPHGAMLLASPRVPGVADRLKGLATLARTRGFRFVEMQRQQWLGGNRAERWNRE